VKRQNKSRSVLRLKDMTEITNDVIKLQKFKPKTILRKGKKI
jgi:hypothetical protein